MLKAGKDRERTLLLVILADELNYPRTQSHARIVQVLIEARNELLCRADEMFVGVRTVNSSLSAKSSPRALRLCINASRRSIAAA